MRPQLLIRLVHAGHERVSIGVHGRHRVALDHLAGLLIRSGVLETSETQALPSAVVPCLLMPLGGSKEPLVQLFACKIKIVP